MALSTVRVAVTSLVFFFLMLLPPPFSTLFPYTTLFRSDLVDDLDPGFRLIAGNQDVLEVLVELLHVRALDRKSTRLNSSHRCISYAVFCLKKKNNISAPPVTAPSIAITTAAPDLGRPHV